MIIQYKQLIIGLAVTGLAFLFIIAVLSCVLYFRSRNNPSLPPPAMRAAIIAKAVSDSLDQPIPDLPGCTLSSAGICGVPYATGGTNWGPNVVVVNPCGKHFAYDLKLVIPGLQEKLNRKVPPCSSEPFTVKDSTVWLVQVEYPNMVGHFNQANQTISPEDYLYMELTRQFISLFREIAANQSIDPASVVYLPLTSGVPNYRKGIRLKRYCNIFACALRKAVAEVTANGASLCEYLIGVAEVMVCCFSIDMRRLMGKYLCPGQDSERGLGPQQGGV